MSCKFGKEKECQKNCKYWINFPEDNNCCLESIDKNGEMSLREVAKRMGLTYVAILQIERRALKKLKKMKNNFLSEWLTI